MRGPGRERAALLVALLAVLAGVSVLADRSQGAVASVVGPALFGMCSIRERQEGREDALRIARGVASACEGAVFICDAGGCLVFANSTASEWFPALAAGTVSPRDLLLGDGTDNDAGLDPISQAIHSADKQRGVRFTCAAERTDYPRYFSANIEPLSVEAGDVDYVVVVVKSLAGLSLFRDAGDEESGLSRVLENLHLVAGIVDISGRVVFCNGYLLALTGWRRDEVVGRDWFSLFSPSEHRDENREVFLSNLRSGVVPSHYRSPIVSRQGKRHPVFWSNATLRDERGEPSASVCIGEDITERAETERRLSQTQNRLRGVLEHMPAMMRATDGEGNIVVWNEECERVTGYSAGEMVEEERALELLLPDEGYRRNVLSELERRGNNFRDWEWTVTCKDGSERIIAWSDISDEVQIPGWASWSIGHDVTRWKRAEEDLAQLARLERFVASVSTRLIRTSSSELDDAIRSALEEVGPLLGVDRSYLTQFTNDGRTISNTHRWDAPDVESVAQKVQDLPVENVRWFMAELDKGAIRVATPGDIPPEASADAEFVESVGARSMLIVPLRFAEERFGCLGVETVRREVTWSEEQVALLQMLANVVAGAFLRKRHEAEARESQEKYRQLFELESQGVLLADMETESIIEANRGAAALYGYSCEELRSMTLSQISAEPDKTQRAVGSRVEHVPLRYHRKRDGTVFPVEARVGYFDWGGRPVAVAAILDITERLAAQQEIESQRAFLNTIIDANPNLIYVKDRAGRMLLANETLGRVTGLAPAELIGERICELAPRSEHAQLLCEGDDDVLRGDVPSIEAEVSFIGSDGMRRWFFVAKHPIADEGGEISMLVAVATDISDLKRAEQALLESEEKYRALFAQAADSILLLEPSSGRIVEFNEEARRNLGFDIGELRGLTLFDLVVGYDEAQTASDLHRLLTEDVVGFETLIERRDGERRNMVINSSSITVSGFGYAQAILRDVTAQKLMEAQSRRLITAIDQTEDSIAVFDLDGRLSFVNSAFEKVTGYAREEVLGKHGSILRPDSAESGPYSEMWGALRAGRIWTGSMPCRRKDGSVFEDEGTHSPIRDAEGSIYGYVRVSRDITDRVALEEQLRQAQKMEAIGRLAGGVAHDFNNLLTLISGYAEILQMDINYDSPLLRHVDGIAKAASKAAGLTQRLLTFGRKAVIKPRVINLNTILSDVEQFVHRLVGESIHVVRRSQNDLWNVRADPGQVEQILLNLVTNARDAMPKGGTLSLETANVNLGEEQAAQLAGLRPGSYVIMSVSDTGVGIDEETRARVFEPFYSTKGSQGTGLGLATTYGIVKQHDGHVWCESTPGVGTTFHVCLPRVEGAVEVQENHTPSEDAKVKGVILFVEDEKNVLSMSSQILERKNFTVLKAETGEEAIELLESRDEPIDLLLTDVVLPGVTGYEVARTLESRFPGVPILFTSGYTDNVVAQQEALNAEVDFLQKPYRLVELLQKVRSILSAR